MHRPAILVSVLALTGALMGCTICSGSQSAGETYSYDEQLSGDVVVPPSWDYSPTVEPKNDGGCGPESNDLCTREGPDSPSCDMVCLMLRVKAHQPATASDVRYLTLIVHIFGPPPKEPLTLPHDGVDAFFTVEEGALYEMYPVTSGRVTPHLKKNEFIFDIDATALTAEGETIAIHDGRYGYVNGRYEEMCFNN